MHCPVAKAMFTHARHESSSLSFAPPQSFADEQFFSQSWPQAPQLWRSWLWSMHLPPQQRSVRSQALPQRPQLPLAAPQPLQQLLLPGAEVAPDEQVAVFEQLRHPPPQALALPRLGLLLLAGTTTSELGDLGLDLLAEFGQRSQHRLDDLLFDVKLAGLVRLVRPQLLDYLGVK